MGPRARSGGGGSPFKVTSRHVMLTTLVSLLLDVIRTLPYLSSTFGIRCTRVPATKRNDGGPSPTFEYSHNLNHIDSTSGSDGPMCGGLQLQIPDGEHRSDWSAFRRPRGSAS